MEEKILDIHNITSLTGWYFDNSYSNNLKDYEPAICLALISTMDIKHGFIEKKVVPIKISDLENLKVGETINPSHDELITLKALKARL